MKPIEARITHAVDILRSGGIVAYPTDTLYGLAVDPRSELAVRRLFAVKARDAGHAVPLIAADQLQAAEAAVFDPLAARVADAFWPGPLSIVLPARAALRAEILGDDGSVAVRVPAHDTARALAAGLGFCITATSANVSGSPATASAAEVLATLGDRIDLLLDEGATAGGPPSTIVDLRAQPRLVRAGAIAWDRVLRSIE